jgi:hypothetical protein
MSNFCEIHCRNRAKARIFRAISHSAFPIRRLKHKAFSRFGREGVAKSAHRAVFCSAGSLPAVWRACPGPSEGASRLRNGSASWVGCQKARNVPCAHSGAGPARAASGYEP